MVALHVLSEPRRGWALDFVSSRGKSESHSVTSTNISISYNLLPSYSSLPHSARPENPPVQPCRRRAHESLPQLFQAADEFATAGLECSQIGADGIDCSVIFLVRQGCVAIQVEIERWAIDLLCGCVSLFRHQVEKGQRLLQFAPCDRRCLGKEGTQHRTSFCSRNHC